MLVFFIILAVALVGLVVLFGKKYMVVKNISGEELLSRFGETAPFWVDFYALFVVPAARVHHERVRPATYKEIEKMARRFRIIVLRVECSLQRFSEYIRGKGKTIPSANSHRSHYWEQICNYKNGNGAGDKKNDAENPAE